MPSIGSSTVWAPAGSGSSSAVSSTESAITQTIDPSVMPRVSAWVDSVTGSV